MLRCLSVVFMLLLSVGLRAQNVYKWEKEHPGQLLKVKGPSVPGFNSNGVFAVINQIPMIHTPRGYDVREGASVRFQGKIYRGLLMVGLPLYYRWDKGPLQRQGEYYMTHIYINDLEVLRDEYSFLFSDETQKLNFPSIFTDTFPIVYKNINGFEVGMARDRVNRNMYVLNPKKKRVFLPVTKEQFVKLWIGKLEMDIEKEHNHQMELKGFIRDMKNNEEAVKNLQEGIHLSALWLNFLKEKKAVYELKLASLSDVERKSQAFAASPRKAAVLQVKGKTVEKVTGDLSDELADGIDAVSTRPLFIFRPDFFDPKLPKTAFQLLVIKDGFRQNWKESELMPLVEKDFFPFIDFKQLGSLMYK